MTKCLVVDDVEVSRYVASQYLSELGVEASVVKNGRKAIEALRQSMVDVVLLDWHLGADSGIEVLKEMRTEFGDRLPIVVFSGVKGQDKADEALRAGASDFLVKPTTLEKLHNSLEGLGISVLPLNKGD